MKDQLVITNGAITINDPSSIEGLPAEIHQALGDRERKFLKRNNNAISALVVSKTTIAQERKRLEEELRRLELSRKIKEIRQKEKLLQEQIDRKTDESRGVIESVVNDLFPGKRLADLVADQIQLPEPAPKGRPRGGAR